jgi:acetolactate synthase-1/2/3 large subunit
MGRAPSTAAVVCETLQDIGVEHVFGLPGSQNVGLFEALRRSRLRTVVATDELGAAFMANGYARAGGRPGVLLTIPGPGFSYALPGLAEAFLDSTPVLHLAGAPADGPGRAFRLQAIDQEALASPLVKRVFAVERVAELRPRLEEAYALTRSGEPGPVLVQLPHEAVPEPAEAGPAAPLSPPAAAAGPSSQALDQIERALSGAARVLIYAGQGVRGAERELRWLAERLAALVVTTTSARGALPEDHPQCRSFDFGAPAIPALNGLLGQADVVFALGCKFSHNGAHGFRLEIPAEKLVHVDAGAHVLGANYPGRLQVCADVPSTLRALLARSQGWARTRAGWPEGSLDQAWRRARERLGTVPEPRIVGVRPPTPEAFFQALRQAMPAESCLVTDSGLHQALARRYYDVRAPAGLIVPSDMQSMGFAVPAAIGAKLALPERPVVALVGDGGLAACGLELLTAVRDRIPLTVIVFNDGRLGLIRLQQLGAHARTHGTRVGRTDFAMLAAAVGVRHLRLEGDAEATLRRALNSPGVSLVEVSVRDTPSLHALGARALARRALRQLGAKARPRGGHA